MNKFVKVLLYLWQLPQHVIGLALILFLKARKRFLHIGSGALIGFWEYEPKGRFGRFISGGSFGEYIILPPRDDYVQTVPHEYGHSLQSRAWGPLYLIVIGIKSAVFNNLWDRLFHKDWPSEKRRGWYYNRWPEKQADRLGGVKREY